MAESSHPMARNCGRTAPNALTTVPRNRRPIVISRTISGRTKTKTAIKYGMRYAPPPFCPSTAEKRQMLPRPTAAPMAARMNPICDDQRSMDCTW